MCHFVFKPPLKVPAYSAVIKMSKPCIGRRRYFLCIRCQEGPSQPRLGGRLLAQVRLSRTPKASRVRTKAKGLVLSLAVHAGQISHHKEAFSFNVRPHSRASGRGGAHRSHGVSWGQCQWDGIVVTS